MHLETIAIHGGYSSSEHNRSASVPLYQTVGYTFDSSAHAASLFNLESEGFRYGRIGNPTTAVLESRLSLLEGGVGALALSSGQAALYCAVLNILEPGRNLVTVPQIYGTTHALFTHLLSGLGMGAIVADADTPSAVAAAITPDTRAVFCESIGNPAGNVCDLRGLAETAHAHGIPLIVDNTLATPFQLRPFAHGADIIVHSLTKYLGGHGTTLGGAIVDGGAFPWQAHPARFPMFSRPDPAYHGLVYGDRFGATAYISRCRSVYLRIGGATLPPASAVSLMQGMETAALRIERHVANAYSVSRFLHNHHAVAWVDHAGDRASPHHVLAKKYLALGAPAIMTFGLHGGYNAAVRFYDCLDLIKRVVNVGDAKTLACHPASTTHRQMTAAQQLAAGVRPEAIRLSVGIEHIDDILADLAAALARCRVSDLLSAHCERD